MTADDAQPAVDPYTATRWTDLGNAELLVRTFGDRIRWVPIWDTWLIWDGTRWAPDRDGQVTDLAATVARSLLDLALVRSGDERKAAVKWALTSEGRSRIDAMLYLAHHMVPVLPEKLDAQPWLLNCANGTLDLRAGTLRRHDPADLLTKSTAVPYRPDARATLFHAFLERVQPEQARREYLARLLGHALVGAQLEHVLPIWHGGGANGKSTLVDLVIATLGEYADIVEPELLLAGRDQHPTGLADLHGKRLAFGVETDEGRRLKTGLVKNITGGDRIKARFVFRDFFTFVPSHTVILVTNHQPEIRTVDHATWRRVRLVPWDTTIPEHETDKHLPARLRDELPGVLAWLAAGCTDWRDRDGLDEPASVLEATESYRAEQDALAGFLADCCETGPKLAARSAELRTAYTGWCAANGVDPLPANQLGERLRLHGFDPYKDRSGRRWWRGVGLASG